MAKGGLRKLTGVLSGSILLLLLVNSSAGEDCWWTGCQLDSWAVKGCEQYGRKEKGEKPCDGGKLYNCCAELTSDPDQDDDPPARGVSCWWTGCQPSSWATRGCQQYGMKIKAMKPCPGGDKYECCASVSQEEDDYWRPAQPEEEEEEEEEEYDAEPVYQQFVPGFKSARFMRRPIPRF